MKQIVKKVLKSLLIFSVATLVIYFLLTMHNFINWANENQLKPYINDEDILNMNREKIKEVGERVGLFEKVMEESLNEPLEDGQHVLAEYFDPLGFSVWSYMNEGIQKIFNNSTITLSILTSIGITIAFITITSKKLNIIAKIIIGYFAVILIVPHIYMYSYTSRVWDFISVYKSIPIYFYIGYTIVFVAMYIINYVIGVRMTKKLNEVINR